MKTKAYKLAAELGLDEDAVLEWLRTNGYPNARRADTIRAEVAVAARKALTRVGGAPRPSAGTRSHAAPLVSPRGAAPHGGGRDNLKLSFAELFEGQAERPIERTDDAPGDRPEARLKRAEEERDAQRTAADEWRVRFNRARSERDEAVAEAARMRQDAGDAPALRAERDQLAEALAQTTRALKSALDERATLESTCAELQTELSETRAALVTVEGRVQERDQTGQELAAAVQREVAWRARALELERAAMSGVALSTLLARVGMADVESQAQVVMAALGQREAAQALLRLLRPSDGDQCVRLLTERVRRCCVDPLCNQVVANQNLIALRVDAESACEVCHGNNERRWFLRMTQECERAGVRRLLLVGGTDAVHEQVRGLCQGLRVDFRIVGAHEELVAARIQGRVEGCDMLVLWGPELVDAATSAAYGEAAQSQDRPVAYVIGPRCSVYALARAVTNRVTRSLVLTTL